MTSASREMWEQVRDNEDQKNWCVIGFNDNKQIDLVGSGTGGLSELTDLLGENEDKVLFCGLRVHAIDDRGTVTSVRIKFVQVQWVGPNVRAMQRGAVMQRRGEFESVLKGTHVNIQTSDCEDLTPVLLTKKLHESTGAHKPSGYDFNPQDMTGEGTLQAAAGNPPSDASTKAAASPKKEAAPKPAAPAPAAPAPAAAPKPAAAPAAAPAPAPVAAPAPAASWSNVAEGEFDADKMHRVQVDGCSGWWYASFVAPKMLVFTPPGPGLAVVKPEDKGAFVWRSRSNMEEEVEGDTKKIAKIQSL